LAEGKPVHASNDQAADAGSLTSRLYEREADLQQMQGLLMTARSQAGDWRFWHVGDLMWGFFVLACHLDPREHIRLWHNGEGRLVGYAMLGEDPLIDWQVLPEYEWSGIEAEAMAWAHTRLDELRKRDPARWTGDLVSGARQDDARRIMFLQSHGFRCGEHTEVNLLRSLDEPIPGSVLPPGCQIRGVAEEGEVSLRAAAQREVWQPWSVGRISDEDYARCMRMPGYHRDLDVVAVMPDGVIAAYANGWIDPINLIGDFGPVGTLPAYRRQGLARAALLEGLRRMKEHGMDRVCISTGESNAAALQLYESIGFKPANQYLEYVKNQ
jgi:mycothiol synthase